jgi:hypothetical protein
MDLGALAQAWIHTEQDVPVDDLNPDFLPDPEADNWMEDAILKAQGGYAPLWLMQVFGSTLLTEFSLGNGDVLAYQFLRGSRRNVLWLHEEPWTWIHGGSPEIDFASAERFIGEWWKHSRDLERLAASAAQAPTLEEGLAALDEDDRALVQRFIADFEARFPEGAQLPGGWGLNAALGVFVPREESASPNLQLLSRSGWICGNFIGIERCPTQEQRQVWHDAIAASVRDWDALSPTLVLFRLWGGFFAGSDLTAMVALAKEHPWRAIRDSARLIERLLVDPTIGEVTLVTAATVEARQAAERAAAEAAARLHQESLDAGNIHLEPIRTAPPAVLDHVQVAAKAVPESFTYRFAWARTSFDPDKDIAPGEWLGQTSAGLWFGVRGVPNPSGKGGKHLQLLSGVEDLTPFEPDLVWNGYAANPHEFVVRAEHAYVIREHDLIELCLRDHTHRALIAHDSEVGVLPQPLVVWSFTFVGDELWTLDHDSKGRYVRRCSLQPGGPLEVVEVRPLFASDIAYDAATDTVALFTMEHGMWFIDGATGRVFFRVAWAASTTLAQKLRFRRTEHGLVFIDQYQAFELVNLDKPDRTIGVPWAELADDPSRLSDVPTDVRDGV